MNKVKSIFEKDEEWLMLKPEERLAIATRLRRLKRKKGVNYSLEGMKVTITRLPKTDEKI